MKMKKKMQLRTKNKTNILSLNHQIGGLHYANQTSQYNIIFITYIVTTFQTTFFNAHFRIL